MIKKLFEDQKDDETVIKIFRRHWLDLLPTGILSSFLIIFTLGLFIGHTFFSINKDLEKMIIVLESVFVLLAVTFFYVKWALYYLTIGVITNERIVDVDQNNLLSRNTASATLENIEDISVDVTGFWNTFFNVGTIAVMTAGEVPNLEFNLIKNPEGVANEIHQAIELAKEKEAKNVITITGNEPDPSN